MELFDKFSELLGDEPITLKEYCELLDAGFDIPLIQLYCLFLL